MPATRARHWLTLFFRDLGSLGIPRVGWLEKIGLHSRSTKEYLFYDTSLSNCIENAFHALALDEHRNSFSPAVWEKPRGNKTVRTDPLALYAVRAFVHCFAQNLRQVWFPGVHSNIGGGYEDQGMANITLAWMMSQLNPLLDFDPDYILDQYEETREYYIGSGQKPRRWSFGRCFCRFLWVSELDFRFLVQPDFHIAHIKWSLTFQQGRFTSPWPAYTSLTAAQSEPPGVTTELTQIRDVRPRDLWDKRTSTFTLLLARAFCWTGLVSKMRVVMTVKLYKTTGSRPMRQRISDRS